MFVVWLCLVKRKHYIVAALTIFVSFNGIELLLRHTTNEGERITTSVVLGTVCRLNIVHVGEVAAIAGFAHRDAAWRFD